VFGQNSGDKSLEYYNEGLKMFQENKYKESESFFTLSAEISPHPDTYYNLALTKYNLKDTCGFCKNIKLASFYGDKEAGKLYVTKCIKQDTIKYKNVLYKDTILSSVISADICTSEKRQQFLLKDFTNERIIAFYIYESNNPKEGKKDYMIEFPDVNKIPDNRIVCDIVDQLPQFPGGEEGRVNYLTSHLKYPQIAKELGIQGVSYIRFIIDETGQVSSVGIARGIGGGCDEESVRVVKLMPIWIPAMREGKPVRVNYQMPIKFTLN